VHQRVLVGVLKPRRRLADGLACVCYRQRAAGMNELGKILALQVFHGQVMLAFALAGIVGVNQIGMVKATDRRHFAQKTGHRLGMAGMFGRQEFDRRKPLQPRVPRFVHAAHPSSADLHKEFILS